MKYLEQQAQLNQISTAVAMAKTKTHQSDSPKQQQQEEGNSQETPPAVAVELDEALLSQYFAKETTVYPSLVFHYPSKDKSSSSSSSSNTPKQSSLNAMPLPIRDDIFILSISSLHKRQLQLAQLETFGQIFTIVFVEEAHTPLCVRCTTSDTPTAVAKRALGNNLGWNCAQQRTLQALRLFVSQWRYWVDRFVSYLNLSNTNLIL